MLVDLANEFLMVDVTSSYNNDVVSKVVSGVEISNVISSQAVELVFVSLHWLSHHVFSVDIEMNIINQGVEILVMVLFVFLEYFFLNQFKFASTNLAVADHVSESLNSSVYITLEYLETE